MQPEDDWGRPSKDALSGLRFLVVDDDPVMRRLFTAILCGAGAAEVAVADSGEQALERLRVFEPDVLITDLKMGMLDGIALISRLREGDDQYLREIPAILLTGYTEERHFAAGEEAGADAILAKPIMPRALVTLVRNIIGNRPALAATHRGAPA